MTAAARRAAARALVGAGAALATAAEAEVPGTAVADLSGVVLSLGLIVGLILVGAFVLRRTPFGAGARSNGLLKVVAALPLGPRERLLLVEARGTELLIAVSPAGVFNVSAAANAAAPQPSDRGAGEPVFSLGAQR